MALVQQDVASFGPASEVICSVIYDDVTLLLTQTRISNHGTLPAYIQVVRTADGAVFSETVAAGITATHDVSTANIIGSRLTGRNGSVTVGWPGYTLGARYPA